MDAMLMEARLKLIGFEPIDKQTKGDVFINSYEGSSVVDMMKFLRCHGYIIIGRKGPVALYRGDDNTRVSCISMGPEGLVLSHFNGELRGSLRPEKPPGMSSWGRLWRIVLWLMLLAFLWGAFGAHGVLARHYHHHHYHYHGRHREHHVIVAVPPRHPTPVAVEPAPEATPEPAVVSTTAQIDDSFQEITALDNDVVLKAAYDRKLNEPFRDRWDWRIKPVEIKPFHPRHQLPQWPGFVIFLCGLCMLWVAYVRRDAINV